MLLVASLAGRGQPRGKRKEFCKAAEKCRGHSGRAEASGPLDGGFVCSETETYLFIFYFFYIRKHVKREGKQLKTVSGSL